MKVIYYTKPCFADCDFPLIQELQNKGTDVRVYMPIHNKFKSASIIEFDKPFTKWGLIKASKLKEMQIYSECLDLDRLYLICGQRNKIWWPFTWLLYIITLIHMILQKADIFHVTWQFDKFDKIFLHWNFKGGRVFTVHDPISHLGNDSSFEEKNRLGTIKWVNHFILLSSQLKEVFVKKYNLSVNQVSISRLGAYNCYSQILRNNKTVISDKPYILYYGSIKKYKGVEFLLEAMKKVHDSCDDLNLIVAGYGEPYFDKEKYNNLKYIEFRNRYIGLKELVNLIKNAQFVVCPYVEATQSGVVQTAFSLNCPLIVTDVGNLGKIVDNGVTGRVVRPKDTEAIAEAIISMYLSPDTCKKYRNNIKKIWQKQMSWSPIADEYITIYKHVIDS